MAGKELEFAEAHVIAGFKRLARRCKAEAEQKQPPAMYLLSTREHRTEQALAMPAGLDARVPAKSPLRMYNLSLSRDTCHFGGSKTTDRCFSTLVCCTQTWFLSLA